jgi:hypothetical protein
MLEQFRAARRASTPLVAVETPDPAETVDHLMAFVREKEPESQFYRWDRVRGLVGLDKKAQGTLGALNSNPKQTANPVEALTTCWNLPGSPVCSGSIVFMLNAQRVIDEASVMQSIWNLRDEFKRNKRTLVLLAPSLKLPTEIANDVVVLDEPYPDREKLADIVAKQYKNAKLVEPDGKQMAKVLDAIIGLPAYAAETVVAMSLTRAANGVDLDLAWNRKVKAISQTQGLSVWRGTDRLEDVKGVDQAVKFFRLMDATDAYSTIVFIDEMEKALAGGMSNYSGDSGVSKDQVGYLLSYMEDMKAQGAMLAGVAGTGKTQLVKGLAGSTGKPLIKLDLGEMKGGKIGSSEQAIRAAGKTITATSEGRVLFIATANQTASFTPEINRRFGDQFFFDSPDEVGRRSLWSLYVRTYGLPPSAMDLHVGQDEGWTGHEIMRICKRASEFKISLRQASEFIVPLCVRSKDVLKAQRMEAAGKFLSASYPGPYQMPPEREPVIGDRLIELE